MDLVKNSKPKQVMLIEDNINHAKLLMRFFQNRRGYNISHYSDPEEALSIITQSIDHVFDIILLDYSLGSINGIEFLKKLNNSDIIKKPPVIMITGHGDENIAVEAMKLGAMDYVVKTRDWLKSLPTKIGKSLVYQELGAEVEELRALSQAVFDNSFDSILVTDYVGIIQHLNPSLLTMTGHSQDDLISKMHLKDLFTSFELAKQILESAKNGHKIRNLKTKITPKYGIQIPVAVSAGPMSQDKILIVLTDLRIEEELSEEIKLFRKFSADLIFTSVFKVGNIGPEVVITEKNPFSNEVLQKMAIFYSVSLGQGDNEHQGLYGPLPVPSMGSEDESTKYLSLIYSFSIEDPSNLDPRAKGKSFAFLAISMPESLIEIYSNRRRLSSKLNKAMEEIKSVDQLTDDFLSVIKTIVLDTSGS